MNIGIITALCSAVAFGSFISTAPLFYSAGGDALSLMMIRILVATVFFAFVAVIKGWFGGGFVFPHLWRDRFLVMGFGVGVAGMGLCYLQAVAYIPVSLAVMIFFTWPIVTALIAPLLGRDLPNRWQGLCLLGAFLCLLPAIGPQLGGGVNMVGVMWAGAASICVSLSLHMAHAVSSRGISLVALGFGSSGFALCLVIPGLWIGGYGFDFAWGFDGWGLVSILGCFYIVGLGCQILATRYSVPEFVAIFYNIEPLVTLFGAYLLLGELLGFYQYVSCLGVVLFLCFYCLVNMRKKKVIEI